jgi:hypothetical protein
MPVAVTVAWLSSVKMDPQARGSMTKRREGKCLCCGDNFTLDVRNRGRQKYCSKQSCRAAGKAARQRRWLAKPQNRNYFREADNAARVREWGST